MKRTTVQGEVIGSVWIVGWAKTSHRIVTDVEEATFDESLHLATRLNNLDYYSVEVVERAHCCLLTQSADHICGQCSSNIHSIEAPLARPSRGLNHSHSVVRMMNLALNVAPIAQSPSHHHAEGYLVLMKSLWSLVLIQLSPAAVLGHPIPLVPSLESPSEVTGMFALHLRWP